MPMKQWARRLQPVRLHAVLVLTLLFFVAQLVLSHLTHALTLLVESYRMMCNLIALTGRVITIQHSNASLMAEEESSVAGLEVEGGDGRDAGDGSVCSRWPPSKSERRLRNTFGWARIDVLVLLVSCVFLASLCFSLVVEALQTLVHIEHRDEMHHSLAVFGVGVCGLLLNLLSYALLGGFSSHQGGFLAEPRLRRGPWEAARDFSGCLFVIVCSITVYLTDKSVAKLVDPLLSVLSVIVLLALSYPYMKESCLILLQTIPDTINIETLRRELLVACPDVLNVHDLHVWRLTGSRIYSTAHVIFVDSQDYARKTQQLTDFFKDQGITQVTIQPEFFKFGERCSASGPEEQLCLVPCHGESCLERHCCGQSQRLLQVVSAQSVPMEDDVAIPTTKTTEEAQLDESVVATIKADEQTHAIEDAPRTPTTQGGSDEQGPETRSEDGSRDDCERSVVEVTSAVSENADSKEAEQE